MLISSSGFVLGRFREARREFFSAMSWFNSELGGFVVVEFRHDDGGVLQPPQVIKLLGNPKPKQGRSVRTGVPRNRIFLP